MYIIMCQIMYNKKVMSYKKFGRPRILAEDDRRLHAEMGDEREEGGGDAEHQRSERRNVGPAAGRRIEEDVLRRMPPRAGPAARRRGQSLVQESRIAGTGQERDPPHGLREMPSFLLGAMLTTMRMFVDGCSRLVSLMKA